MVMARFKNRSTVVHETITGEFRSSLKKLSKTRVPTFGEESSRQGNTSRNPAIQVLKNMGVPLDSLKPKRGINEAR